MPLSSSFIKLLEKVEPELRDVFLAFFDEIEKQRTITREEFNDLKEIVRDLAENLSKLTQKVDQLAEAQRKTEERLNQLAQRVDELAEAQRRTEERLNQLAEAQRRTEERLNQLAQRVDELAEAQRRTEERLNQLAQRVDELAEAQRRTEERLNQLAEAQRKTEERLNQLAEAQRKTEERLALLIKEFRDMRRQFGDLSDSVGYGLEDRACKFLPKLLERDYGVKVIGKLVQEFIFDPRSGKYIEVNIFGKGTRDGESVVIIGEAKSRLSKNKVNEFIRDKVNKISKIYENVFPVLVIYVRSEPDTVEYAKSKGVAVYYSRELE